MPKSPGESLRVPVKRVRSPGESWRILVESLRNPGESLRITVEKHCRKAEDVLDKVVPVRRPRMC
jgi:hypothetical protein